MLTIKTTDSSTKQASLYAGPALPAGARIVGLVDGTDPHRKGAAVLLASGQVVQFNAGSIRTLPPLAAMHVDAAPCPHCGQVWIGSHIADGSRIYWCRTCSREYMGEVVDIEGMTADELSRED